MGGAAPGGGLLRSHQDLLTAPTTSASLGWRNQRLQRGRPARGRPHLAQPMWPSGRTVQQGQGAHACGTPQHRQHRNGVAFLHPLLCEHRPRRSKWEHGRSGFLPAGLLRVPGEARGGTPQGWARGQPPRSPCSDFLRKRLAGLPGNPAAQQAGVPDTQPQCPAQAHICLLLGPLPVPPLG